MAEKEQCRLSNENPAADYPFYICARRNLRTEKIFSFSSSDKRKSSEKLAETAER